MVRRLHSIFSSPSTSALAVQLTENRVFGEVVSDSGEVSTTSSGSNERVT